MDRDGDGAIDRHWGYDTYIGSGAWLTNHQSGEYEQEEETITLNYFFKIVAEQLKQSPELLYKNQFESHYVHLA